MNLSKKTRYGLRALVDLAVHADAGHVPLSSIAERGEISQQYLEQVFASLKKADIVKSIKGSGGGYLLARDAAQIPVGEIVEALEGDYRVAPEDADAASADYAISVTIQELLIDRLNEQLKTFFSGMTLADLVKAYTERQGDGQDMYYI